MFKAARSIIKAETVSRFSLCKKEAQREKLTKEKRRIKDFALCGARPTLHYQHLDESGRIIGGAGEWFLSGFAAGEVKSVTSTVAIPLPTVKKVIYSMDFDALELVKE